MKKLKIPVAIIITQGLLHIFACLPKIVSGILDYRSGKAPSYNNILSVKLDISQDRQELSFTDKLLLLKDAQTVNLNQSQATMTEGEVEGAITAFLQQCESAGIYEAFEPTYVSMQPKLMYDLSDSSKHLVVWTVTMMNNKEPNQTLLFDVDDETGAILCMTYNIYRSYTMDDVWERNKLVMDRFVDLYFYQLGMAEAADAAETNPSYDVGYEYKEVDGGVSEAIYTFTDATIETFAVQITVDGAGGFMIPIL